MKFQPSLLALVLTAAISMPLALHERSAPAAPEATTPDTPAAVPAEPEPGLAKPAAQKAHVKHAHKTKAAAQKKSAAHKEGAKKGGTK